MFSTVIGDWIPFGSTGALLLAAAQGGFLGVVLANVLPLFGRAALQSLVVAAFLHRRGHAGQQVLASGKKSL